MTLQAASGQRLRAAVGLDHTMTAGFSRRDSIAVSSMSARSERSCVNILYVKLVVGATIGQAPIHLSLAAPASAAVAQCLSATGCLIVGQRRLGSARQPQVGCINSMVMPSGPETYATTVPARGPAGIGWGEPFTCQPAVSTRTIAARMSETVTARCAAPIAPAFRGARPSFRRVEYSRSSIG